MIMKSTIVFCICIGIICKATRSDETGTILSSEGKGGDWSNTMYCDEGYFAKGFSLKVGSSTTDAVGADAFSLRCLNGDYYYTIHADNDGIHGTWSDPADCPSAPYQSYIVGFQTKVQQPGGDDTALNSVKIICSDGTEKHPSIEGSYGSWGSETECGAKESVCGFKQNVQAFGGTFVDDTALNAIRLICCENPKTFSNPIGYWKRVGGLGGGGTLTAETTVGVTNHEEKEVTQTFGTSVTNEVSAGLEFEGMGISGSTSHTMSSEIAQKTVQDVSTTYELKMTFECKNGAEAMYQWIIKMTEDAMTETSSFEIKTNDWWCVSDNQLSPQCPYGYCRDKDCQVCSYEPTVEPTRTVTTSNANKAATNKAATNKAANHSSSVMIYIVIGCSVFVCVVLIIGCMGGYIVRQKKNHSANNYALLEGTAVDAHL